MKQLLAFLVLLVMIFSVGCNSSPAESNSAKNKQEPLQTAENEKANQSTDAPTSSPISDFEYAIDQSKYAVIKKYIGSSKNVVIPNEIDGYPVRGIGIGAFEENALIEEVVIPDSVEMILNYAFHNCTSLKSVKFGKNVEDIFIGAFLGCVSLEEVILPENMKRIDSRAFWECTSIKKLFINKNIEYIGDAFTNSPIKELIIEDGVKSLGCYASFWGAELTEVVIPESVEWVREYSFNEKLEKVTFLGDAPEKVDDYPFGIGDVTIFYPKDSKGWDTTPLKDTYTLVAY
ncbi:MAG: leucine-rich repeat domain-containing protein [Oscillospiraceae bacterium]|nr:leucine-rich repeat domain-containing protein [Oscillospiraceae bacterium]